MSVEKWVKASTLEESEEYHKRYNYAITNPVRRKILRLIDEGKSEGEIMAAKRPRAATQLSPENS